MLTMNYSYRINPTVQQQELMLAWLETCRRLYNRCLRDIKDWLNSRKCSLYSCSLNREYIMFPDIPFPSYLEQKRQLTQWKKTNSWLKEVHSQVTQDCVKRLHNTWERFKSQKFGFPRYKKFGRYQSFLFPQFQENPIKNGFIKLPKIGKVEINQHRPIPDGFSVKGVRIVSRVRGTVWYAVVTIQCDVQVPEPLPFGRGIGVDIGLESFLVTSDNFRVEPARFFRDLQSRLKVLQSKASRKKKGGKNWEKAQRKVAKLYHQISNAHTGKKELRERVHHCPECGYITTRDYASSRVILQRGLNNIVRLDESERKLSAECVLPGVAISR